MSKYLSSLKLNGTEKYNIKLPAATTSSIVFGAGGIEDMTIGRATVSDEFVPGTINGDLAIVVTTARKLLIGNYGAAVISIGSGATSITGSLAVSGRLTANTLCSVTSCPHLIPKAASDNVRNAHSGSVTSVVNTSWQMLRTIVFTNGLKGTQRFKWSVYNNQTDNSVYSILKKNGVDLSTSQDHPANGWWSYSQDIAVDWLPGDQLEFWAYSYGGNVVPYGIDVFSVSYDDLPDIAVAYTTSG